MTDKPENKPEITDQEILAKLAAWVVRRRMTAPAIIFLETHRPLSFVGSQALLVASPIVHFFEPFLQALMGPGYQHDLYKRFATLLENRENVERLIIEIERENQRVKEIERVEKRRQKEIRKQLREQKRALRQTRRTGALKGE